jgi:hypothetical protein
LLEEGKQISKLKQCNSFTPTRPSYHAIVDTSLQWTDNLHLRGLSGFGSDQQLVLICEVASAVNKFSLSRPIVIPETPQRRVNAEHVLWRARGVMQSHGLVSRGRVDHDTRSLGVQWAPIPQEVIVVGDKENSASRGGESDQINKHLVIVFRPRQRRHEDN